MSPTTTRSGSRTGFAGAVSGLPLADVIQLKGHNRFSGVIAVECMGKKGVIHFAGGEVVHAEQGEKAGEEAFYEILCWPGGRFVIQPSAGNAPQTIRRALPHLLLEAHRLLDEARARLPREQSDGRTAASDLRRQTGNPVVDRLLPLPGVAYAVLQDGAGVPLGDDSATAEALAAKGRDLNQLGERLGDLFWIGPLHGVAVHGRQRQLLVFTARDRLLTVAVKGDQPLHQVEADIRAVLSAGG
jgi:predicted regulator of Ras-like GTPase activity (Roadblock/LC7/MglB family)